LGLKELEGWNDDCSIASHFLNWTGAAPRRIDMPVGSDTPFAGDALILREFAECGAGEKETEVLVFMVVEY
jgi:hypothetical protein